FRHAVFPSGFRLQVNRMTQKHSSELLLTASGIQHRAPRRTVTPHPARALMSRSALVNLFQPRGCPEGRSMKQVPSSNFSQGEELTEVPDVRTSRKSAPFRVGSLRAGGPIRPVTGRRSLPPTSFTRYSIPLPCGWDTTEVGSVGLTQLPTEKNV